MIANIQTAIHLSVGLLLYWNWNVEIPGPWLKPIQYKINSEHPDARGHVILAKWQSSFIVINERANERETEIHIFICIVSCLGEDSLVKKEKQIQIQTKTNKWKETWKYKNKKP